MVDSNNNAGQPATLGGYLRQERERLGLSQRAVATLAGIHHSKLARLESGEITGPLPQHLQDIADALGVDVSKLLKYLGVTPKPELPSVRVYFRRKLGVDADEAEVLANLVAEYQQKQKESSR